MATAIKHFSGSVGSTGGTSVNWTNEDADLELCFSSARDQVKELSTLFTTDAPKAVAFNNDGTKIFIASNGSTEGLKRYDLSTAWDIESTYSNAQDYDFYASIAATTSASPYMLFNDDGTQLLISTTSELDYFNLSTAYDLSTISYGGEIEEGSGQISSMYNPSWGDNGKYLYCPRSSYLTVYEAGTAYDFSTLKFAGSAHIAAITNGGPFEARVSMSGGLFYDATSNIHISLADTSLQNTEVRRYKQLTSGYWKSFNFLHREASNTNQNSGFIAYLTPDYGFFVDSGGGSVSGIGAGALIRYPLSHTVAADTTIYTVPTGKVAKVTMNMSGQTANVYVDDDKIADIKGGGHIVSTSTGMHGTKYREYSDNQSDLEQLAPLQRGSTAFYARGGSTMLKNTNDHQGPEYFLLTAGESLKLKNSVSVNYDVRVIEDNASS
jgi:hypothetical protein